MTPVGPVTVTDALLLLLLGLVFCEEQILHLSHFHLSHLTPYLFQIFVTTIKMEDQRGIIIEERGKTIYIIFIGAKQDGGRKDIIKYD